ncbi:MAG: NAD(+)/NADH kinase [Thermoleophilaceae bacterium]|nr:NAD(+)/NADH kinase [Thermoleophilaceae bacterium]
MDRSPLRQLGLVVHPTRHLEAVLEGIAGWASAHGVEVGQVQVAGQTRHVAEPVEAAACELLVAVGGDGTTLAALHAGASPSRPVLGVACGSVGVLTSVAGDEATSALDRFMDGRWAPGDVPGLEVTWDETPGETAINDVAVIRGGPGQLLVSVCVDDVLYAQLAGDGLVVATALGSSAYTMAAGGPLLAPGADGMAVTPLAPHGGSCPPLVAGGDSHLSLTIQPGFGGVRFEIDGRPAAAEGLHLAVRVRPGYATLVRLADEEPRLTGLRRRGLVLDSPRVLAREARLPDLTLPGVPPSP